MKHSSRTATSTSTAFGYKAVAAGRENYLRYERVEPSLKSVMAQNAERPAPSDRFDEIFGDLPSDGEG